MDTTIRLTPGTIARIRCFRPWQALAYVDDAWCRVDFYLQADLSLYFYREDEHGTTRFPITLDELKRIAADCRLWLCRDDARPYAARDMRQAAELHRELGRAGVRDHYVFASEVIGREVTHFRLLSLSERNALRNALPRLQRRRISAPPTAPA